MTSCLLLIVNKQKTWHVLIVLKTLGTLHMFLSIKAELVSNQFSQLCLYGETSKAVINMFALKSLYMLCCLMTVVRGDTEQPQVSIN